MNALCVVKSEISMPVKATVFMEAQLKLIKVVMDVKRMKTKYITKANVVARAKLITKVRAIKAEPKRAKVIKAQVYMSIKAVV